MKCDDPECQSFNKTSAMYCEKCIQIELNKMSYEEVADMYAEGKDWLEGISYNEKDEEATEMVEKFKVGWFALLNIVLLSKAREKNEE